MPNEPIKIRTSDEGSPSAANRRRRSSSMLPWIVGSAVSALVVALATIVLRGGDSDSAPAEVQTGPTRDEPVDVVKPENGVGAKPQAEMIVPDDGKLLWASPTSGEPISLDYVPAGAQILFYWRPALLAQHRQWERLVAALGPWGVDALAEFQRGAACQLQELDSVMTAMSVLENRELGTVHRITLRRPWDDNELSARFPQSLAFRQRELEVRRTESRSYFLPAEHDGRVLIICPKASVDSLIDPAETPPLVRDIERLWELSDDQRAATLLVAPKFLEAGGRGLLAGPAERLHEALRWLSDDDATAIMFSAHLADNLFLELAAAPQLQTPPRRYALSLKARLGTASNYVEDAILSATWAPYGRKLLARLPGMLRKLSGYTRSDVENRLALCRCYLPDVAAHNLVMAGELFLTQHPESPATVGAAENAKAKNIEEKLATRTSLSFGKETLEKALELLSEDVNAPIEIAGRDLQLKGITKNQSFGIDLRDKPAGEILVEILLRANPDRSASGPSDPLQELVYVIRRESHPLTRIIVTTRTAARERGEALPTVFDPAAP